MVRPVLVLCLLMTACGDDVMSGDDGPPTEASIAGIYIERTGDSYTGLEFRLGDIYSLGDNFRMFSGTTAADPVFTPTNGFYMDGYQINVVHENDFRNTEIIDIDAFDGTTLEIQGHVFKRVTECPITSRNGAWFWSDVFPDGTAAGSLAMALGPDGPAIAMGGRSDNPSSTLTYARRLGCGFTASALPFSAGESQPRLLYGPDGLPQIAAIQSEYNSVVLTRFDPTMPAGWVVIPIIDSLGNDASAPIGMAIASDGSTWISHSIMGLGDFGLGVSHVARDGTITRSTITQTGGHHHSRLLLDAQGTPHVAYQNSRGDGVFIATMTGATTWSIEGPISTGTPRELSGFAMSSTGAYHVGWTEDIGQTPYARYSTNESGSWVTVPLAVGRGVDVGLDSHDHATVTYVHDVSNDPYIATNASGSWVETKIETAGAPGRAAPHAGGLAYYLSWTSLRFDANDKMHVAFDNSAYATSSY